MPQRIRQRRTRPGGSRRDRLREAREDLKGDAVSDVVEYSLLDYDASNEILGINYSHWILRELVRLHGPDKIKEAFLKLLKVPPGKNYEQDLRILASRVVASRQDDDRAGFNAEFAKALGVNSVTVPSLLNSKDGFTMQDVHDITRDVKLLFRSEHMVAMLNALRPWESFLAIAGEAVWIAYDSFSDVMMEVNKDENATRKSIADGLTLVVSIGLGLLAASGVGAIAAAAIGVATAMLQTGTQIGIKAGSKPASSWLEKKLGEVITTTESPVKKLDKHVIRGTLIDALSKMRLAALAVADVTPNHDFVMLLDYVSHTAKRGFKVGLNTSSEDRRWNNQQSVTKVGEQQDWLMTDDRLSWTSQNQNGVYTLNPPLKAVQLVHKTRNMLEKAFEFRFEELIAGLALPEELRTISADQSSSLLFLAGRLELDLWCNWIRGGGELTDAPDHPHKLIRQHIWHILRDLVETSRGLDIDESYGNWLLDGLSLKVSQAKYRKLLGMDGDRDYPKSSHLREWAAKNTALTLIKPDSSKSYKVVSQRAEEDSDLVDRYNDSYGYHKASGNEKQAFLKK